MILLQIKRDSREGREGKYLMGCAEEIELVKYELKLFEREVME